ncbi:hypothetical protein [Kocuria massiliensis]|uniref:hypothetical protein n=1 Tax=Kocuria massiliensis TaxID=1926282 RepID=UPI000A1CE69F|nr:hypothetical protein [Kocuria massiliensis]
MTESPSAPTGSSASRDSSRDNAPSRGPEEREILVRRAPSVIAFLVTGLILGLIVAAVSTVLGPPDQMYTAGAIFGMMAVIFGTAGAVLGAVIGLIADRRSRKKAQRFRAVRLDDDGRE